MALIECKDCGKEFSTEAVRCPHCGAKPPKSSSGCLTATILFIAFFAFVVFAAAVTGSPTPSKPDNVPSTAASARVLTPEQKAHDLQWKHAVLAATTLRNAMRNPDSFTLSKQGGVLFMADGAVCYEYRAQNGFGGINIGQAVLAPSLKLITSDDHKSFAATWKKECANKTGTDQTDDITLALKLFQ